VSISSTLDEVVGEAADGDGHDGRVPRDVP
jgi:hypothetical protein